MHISLAKPVLPYSEPDLVSLGWNESAVGPGKQDLFGAGYCGECQSPVGPRNDTPVVLSRTPKADICGFQERMTDLLFVSERFLGALSDTEIDLIQPREAVFQRPSANRRRYFEITGEPSIRQVGVRGGKYLRLACWECGTCGRRAFSCSHPELPDTARMSEFVARSDLRGDLDSMFLVRDASDRLRITMSFSRFRELVERLPGVSLWPGRLYCLSDEEVERRPALAPFSSLC